MQQFLAEPNVGDGFAKRDNGTGGSDDCTHRDGHGQYRLDGDLEMHVDHDDYDHGFFGKGYDNYRNRRMRSYQRRLSEVRLGDGRDAKCSDLHGAAIGELPPASARDYVDGDFDGGKKQERHGNRQSGLRHPGIDYTSDGDGTCWIEPRSNHKIYGGPLE